jgi:Methyltransferase domain
MSDIYAKPRVVTNLEQCIFYHAMDIPSYGHVDGQWDLRGRERQYLGNIEFAGKRVLEVGTASGYLCFWMEQQGAEVVAYDLSPEQNWDIVPFAQYDHQAHAAEWRKGIGQLNDAFWLTHGAIKSKAKVVYGSVYEIPSAIGPVDIATFGSILLHLRDPFQALYKASILTRQQIIVTELVLQRGHSSWLSWRFMKHKPVMHFRPDSKGIDPKETWWWLSPELIVEFLKVLGFENTFITYHRQLSRWGEIKLYTVVGHRTTPFTTPT